MFCVFISSAESGETCTCRLLCVSAVGVHLHPHSNATLMTNIDIFTAVRTESHDSFYFTSGQQQSTKNYILVIVNSTSSFVICFICFVIA
jgi:hypothetical protein